MEEPIKKRGPKPRDKNALKKPYSLSLTPSEIVDLEAKAQQAGVNPSAFIIKKLKLK